MADLPDEGKRGLYEKRDVHGVLIAVALAVFCVMVLFSAAVARWTWHTLRKHFERSYSGISPVPESVPPEPRLEADPAVDLERLRRQEETALNQYGWVDRSKEIVHVPIDRAIELLVKQKPPARQALPEARQ